MFLQSLFCLLSLQFTNEELPIIIMRRMAFIVVLLLAVLSEAVLGQDFHCSVNQTIPETLFSTRTMYDAVRGPQIPSIEIEGCKPAALWILMRNAVSNPSPSELQHFAKLAELKDRILENHDQWESDELCDVDLEGLRNWSFSLDIARANGLAEVGKKSIEEFVKRLSTQFPKLLSPTNFNDHLIRHTTSPTTKNTADAFASSLYKAPTTLTFVSDLADWLESKCPSWIRNRQQANEKARLFSESETMKSIVQSIARRFGFNRLDFSIQLRRRLALLTCTRPWNPNSAKVGCSFLSTIIQNFEVYKFNHKVNVQVARELSIRGVLAALGVLGEDGPLTHEDLQPERSWRNSQITPFLANFAAVLHECRAGNVNNNVVSLYLNEKPLPLPWCNNSHVCNFITFRTHLASVINPSFCNHNHCNA